MRDLQTHVTILISRANGANGAKGDSSSVFASISADGRYVAFESSATNLHPDDTDDVEDVFVRDVSAAGTMLVSRANGADGVKGTGSSRSPSISADGRFVTFGSNANNLHSDDVDLLADVFMRDMSTHENSLVSRAGGEEGVDGNASSFSPSVSATGRFVAFGSQATNLHPDDPDDRIDVFLRDVLGPSPIDLKVDIMPVNSDGNGVFEAGERVEVAPTWRNDGTLVRSFGGAASDFTGPEGATYTLVVDGADYGTVEPGELTSCQEMGTCYRMEVGLPGGDRPEGHWDATFEELFSSEANPISRHTWTLHIGDSFTDVPRANAFYPAVETLLHSGVTGGCAADEYCSGGVNNRSQMPVFVLRALEGADYMPPACTEGATEFTDVPATNSFCRWIEELSHRSIVSGCGGGAYCPNAPVTRAQMAIFLLKTLEGADYAPAECANRFDDVPCPSLFADWIEDLAAREITGGCTATNYCPGDPITRAQMAVFVTRTFGLTLYRP